MYDAKGMGNVETKHSIEPFARATYFTHTSTHTGIYKQLIAQSSPFTHSRLNASTTSFLLPTIEKKNYFPSKLEAHSNFRMTPLYSILTLFLLLAQLPATRMTPLRNAKPQVRVSLLFVEVRGLIDPPRESAANDAAED